MRDAGRPKSPSSGAGAPGAGDAGEARDPAAGGSGRGRSPGDELLEHGDGLIELDRDWVIVRVNAAQERTTGLPRSETLGRVFWEVWPEVADPRGAPWREYHRCMQERVPVELESYFAPLQTWFAITAYPTSAGGVAVFFRDVTVQKKAELALRAEHAFTAAVLDTVASIVVVLDRDGAIVRVNSACERATGYAASELVGRSLFDVFIPPAELPGVRETFRQLRAGHFPNQHENRWRMKDGSERTIEWNNTALVGADGEVRFVIGTGLDVTDRRRGEERLREAERQYRSLAENAPEVIARFDRQLRHTYVNEYGAKVYGVPARDVVGKTSAELGMPADKIAFWRRHFEEVLATGEQRTVEFDFDSPAFGRQLFSSLFVPERDEAGRLVSILAITRDVTDARRAEERMREAQAALRTREEDARTQSARLEAVLDAVADGLVVYDRAGRTILSTRAADELLGIPAAERAAPVRERAARQYEVLDEGGRPVPPDELIAYRAAVKGEAVRGQVLSVRPLGGTQRWLRMNAVPLFQDGRHMGAVLSMTDVTERKRAEGALREANARLLDADRRKDEFLGMLSHELRNPLAPIRNSLYILDHSDPGGPQALRAREVARRQVGHLTRLVDDLLDVTRIARGKIELRRADLDLAALARRTAEDYRSLMTERGLTLTVHAPDERVVVVGDETRLAQVLGNLLSNAAKFTPAGGRVRVSLEAGAGRATVSVHDTGPGVAPEVLPTIFDPFTQGEQTLARTEGGLGLGLALVKGLVELHGGSVAVSAAAPDRGATFAVTLPLAPAPGAGAPALARAGRGGPARRRRVLVVDDNRDAAETLAELASMLGHDAEVAYDAYAALGKTVEELPDVVLCDLGLPGMDGYELARQLRARAGARRVSLVAVSGYAQPEDVARAAEAGFDAHVAKPPDPELLAALLGRGA